MNVLNSRGKKLDKNGRKDHEIRKGVQGQGGLDQQKKDNETEREHQLFIIVWRQIDGEGRRGYHLSIYYSRRVAVQLERDRGVNIKARTIHRTFLLVNRGDSMRPGWYHGGLGEEDPPAGQGV